MNIAPSYEDAVQGFLRQADAEGLVEVAYTFVDSPFGRLGTAATEAGLVKVELHADDAFADDLAGELSPRVVEHPARLDVVRRQLDQYFERQRRSFDLPIDWRLARGFRLAVLQRLYAEVPFGQVVTYGELARRVGNPKAVRAVGTAMATNPVPIVVPCHRVLRTGGSLGNYGGGVEMKRALLDLEADGEDPDA